MKREIYTEEHDIFRDAFRKFLEKEVVPHQDEWLKAGIVPREIWKTTGEQGFIAPWLPEEYGGAGADFLYSAVEMEEIARIGETGFALNLHGEIIVPYIAAFGNEEQKKKWLPGCASGDIITAVAMTEPDAGSDLQAIKTTAIKDGDSYVVNGQKTFISNGMLNDLCIVAAMTDPEGRAPLHRDEPDRRGGRHTGIPEGAKAGQARHAFPGHGGAVLRGLPRAQRESARARGGAGLHPADAEASAGAPGHCHRGRGEHVGCPRLDQAVLPGAERLRQADHQVPEHAVQAGGDVHHGRGVPGLL